MDLLAALQEFRAVLDAGSFAGAARRLGKGRSAVQKQMVALENRIGAQLLIRSTRRLTPTQAGLALYERSGGLLDELDGLLRDMAGDAGGEPTGRLRINAPVSFGTLRLSPLVADFTSRHPLLRVELALNDRFIDPVEEGYDLTIRIAEPRYLTSLVTLELGVVRRRLCAAPGYLHTRGVPEDPGELQRHDCLQYGPLATTSHWRLGGTAAELAVPVHCVLWSNNGEVLRDAALAGRGIALLPDFIAEQALAAGRLVEVLPAYRPDDLAIHALYARHRHLAPGVRRLVDHLRDALAPQADGRQDGPRVTVPGRQRDE